MKKILIASLLLVPMALTSCAGTPAKDDKLLAIFTDMTCMAQFGATAAEQATASGATFDMAAFRAQVDTMSKDLQDLMQKSYAKESDMKDAYKAIADKAAFKKQVGEAAAKKCNATTETLDKIFEEVNKDLE